MGEFLSLTGLAGPTPTQVAAALKSYASSAGGDLVPADWEGESDEVLVIAEGHPGRVTIQYPADFIEWDDASAFLSKKLRAPTFSFHIHDGDLWMYGLFADGEQVDGFNPWPDYWAPIPDDERAAWRGNAAEIARRWPGVEAAAVAPYLVTWDDSVRSSQRACPDDSYTFKDAWQLSDFLKRLGLVLPIDDREQPRGSVFEFWTDGN